MPDTLPAVDIAMIGHIAKDRIVYQGHVETATGGAVYYGGMALRQLGLRVAVITRLHPQDWHLLDEMSEAGIAVYATPAPETSGIENIYYTPDMDRRDCRPLGFAGSFRAEEIPPLDTRLWLIGPIIAGEVDLPLLTALHGRGAPLAMDIQGFIRVRVGDELCFRDWPDKEVGLRYITYLKVDSAEAEALTGLTDMRAAAAQLAAWGPREIILTHRDGLIVYAEGEYHEAAFRPRVIRGRTGRGDTTFATYLGKRLSTTPAAACRYAAAVVSLKLEEPGPFRRPLAEVEALLAR